MNEQGDNEVRAPRIELIGDNSMAKEKAWAASPPQDASSGDYGLPVPQNPPHVCPACEYNLTGLTSRRCPECGTPFTLIEARRAARRNEPIEIEDRRAQRWQQAGLIAGWALMAAAIAAPMIASRAIDRWGLFGRTVIVLMCLSGAWMYTAYRHRTLAEAVFLAGAASAMISGFFVYLRW